MVCAIVPGGGQPIRYQSRGSPDPLELSDRDFEDFRRLLNGSTRRLETCVSCGESAMLFVRPAAYEGRWEIAPPVDDFHCDRCPVAAA